MSFKQFQHSFVDNDSKTFYRVENDTMNNY